jgi:hypothetical protein
MLEFCLDHRIDIHASIRDGISQSNSDQNGRFDAAIKGAITMEFVLLVLNVAILVLMIRIHMALCQIRELCNLIVYEDSLPEDLRRYIDGRWGN